MTIYPKSSLATECTSLPDSLRDGREQQLHVREILVGDVQLVGPGDILAVDGIILKSDNLVCDEPTTTDCVIPKTKGPRHYVIAGSKVLSGSGSVVVTAVGSEVYLVSTDRRASLEPEQMWMSRTLFNFGLAGVVSGFLICAITWISMLPFTIGRPFDVSEPYNDERMYDADIASILYKTMRVVIVIAVISVRDTFLLAVVGFLLHAQHCTNFMVASTEFIFRDLAYMDWSLVIDAGIVSFLLCILLMIMLSMLSLAIKRYQDEKKEERRRQAARLILATAVAVDPMSEIFFNSSTSSVATDIRPPPPAYTAKDQHLEFSN
ncbi:hypothetical protein BG000_000412, partial [Podila horticola]